MSAITKLVHKNWYLVHERGAEFTIRRKCSTEIFQGGWYALATVAKYADGYRYQFPDGIGERGTYTSRQKVLEASFVEFETKKIKRVLED